jgi:hypothetical protein
MGKRKAVQGGSRRCRLEIISGASDGAAEEADPIADAIKAKQERRGTPPIYCTGLNAIHDKKIAAS